MPLKKNEKGSGLLLPPAVPCRANQLSSFVSEAYILGSRAICNWLQHLSSWIKTAKASWEGKRLLEGTRLSSHCRNIYNKITTSQARLIQRPPYFRKCTPQSIHISFHPCSLRLHAAVVRAKNNNDPHTGHEVQHTMAAQRNRRDDFTRAGARGPMRAQRVHPPTR